jgi:hypothetical protein
MHFLEKDLENIIWESDNEKLRERGFFINGKKLRQLRIGNYGIADLITYKKYNDNFGDKYLEITVFELKKEKAGISAFLQALRYCRGISSYLDDYKPNILYKFNIVICAKEIDKNSDYIFLTDLISSDEFNVINNITNYSFTYNIDGIIFKQENGYNIINKGF